jgi:spore germination protein
MRQWMLTLTVLAVCLAPPGGRASAEANRPALLGYYVPYDSTSWASLEAHADALDFVAAQWVSVDPCGGLGSRDDQTLKQLARTHNLKILPSLATASGTLNHTLHTDPVASPRLIQNIVDYTVQENYAGFDLDFEGVDSVDRDALSAFVGETASALHAQGKLLTLAVPAKERDVTVGWSGAYDYAALGAEADLVSVMAYAFRGPFSGPGSVAPYAWIDRVLAFTTQQIDPDKVLLGLAAYGYDWNTTSGGTRGLSFVQAAALAARYASPIETDPSSRSGTFSYTNLPGDDLPVIAASPSSAHDVTVRTPPTCDIPGPSAPAPSAPPVGDADTPQVHEVWIEDSSSIEARLQLASSYGVRGIAAWRLGLEDPRVWDALPARSAPLAAP